VATRWRIGVEEATALTVDGTERHVRRKPSWA
jgi:hypothetical protein